MASNDETTDAIRIAAHDWQARIEAGDMTPAERQAFDAWLAADPRHRSAYDRAARLWREVAGIERTALPSRSLRPLPRERFIAWRSADWRRWPLRFAAGSAVLATLLLVMLLTDPTALLSPDSKHFETQVAETREIALADGSSVTLGARTRISVELGETARNIRLHSGDAFFEVAKDSARPFIVESDGAYIEALGTAFDVRRRPERLGVAVAEGTVEFRATAPNDQTVSTRLSAGQQISADRQGVLDGITAIQPATVGAWRRSRLVYNGAALSDVVADANRYHDDWILLRDRTAAQLEITAVFDAADIDGMLAALGEALPIVVWRAPGPLIMIGSRPPDVAN
ncbi:FecR family protein [Algihabitans albus]|uniref:FecR family protein n=1 Tax=Algihabitans albus TaxID=2164067 RepID=UPI0013C2DD7E|nr:FecR domain-containing protein [Algihabitans albus]